MPVIKEGEMVLVHCMLETNHYFASKFYDPGKFSLDRAYSIPEAFLLPEGVYTREDYAQELTRQPNILLSDIRLAMVFLLMV